MTEEQFASLPVAEKWLHLSTILDYILSMDSQYSSKVNNYELRRRFNPHHSDAYVKEEEKQLKHELRKIRTDQYVRWKLVKELYATHRDEMTNTLEIEKYAKYKNIIENVFTMELDDALKKVINE